MKLNICSNRKRSNNMKTICSMRCKMLAISQTMITFKHLVNTMPEQVVWNIRWKRSIEKNKNLIHLNRYSCFSRPIFLVIFFAFIILLAPKTINAYTITHRRLVLDRSYTPTQLRSSVKCERHKAASHGDQRKNSTQTHNYWRWSRMEREDKLNKTCTLHE